MVTKLKTIKVRDAEQTQRDLLEAVGKILSEHGFRSLNTKNITDLIGKDKNIIRYHFKSLKDLEKSYINEKDYWPPFFKRFNLGLSPERKKVEQMFTELMQENFRYFFSNKEMQQIILWQISEANPLLRSISENRETEGAKLLQLTDPYFQGTDINFRAILALLLGGLYYVTLHARYNKSTVSGIDVNQAEDRKEVIKTIGHVLGWAWQAASREQTKN
jgi:AcrR family transcriptional regulator